MSRIRTGAERERRRAQRDVAKATRKKARKFYTDQMAAFQREFERVKTELKTAYEARLCEVTDAAQRRELRVRYNGKMRELKSALRDAVRKVERAE